MALANIYNILNMLNINVLSHTLTLNSKAIPLIDKPSNDTSNPSAIAI